MNAGMILAAGKGTRFKAGNKNKTASSFSGKPLVIYGIELLSDFCDKIIIVVGAYSESIIELLGSYKKVLIANQKKRLGTGHAVKVGLEKMGKEKFMPEKVFVGYGDHMMFYTPEVVKRLDNALSDKEVLISMVTCDHDDPESLAWGRIVIDKNGNVEAIVEQKDANSAQLKITELNAGFYCFDYSFLEENINKIERSEVSGEYYLTDLVKIANNNGKKVVAIKVPFEEVGIGINTKAELRESLKLFKKRNFSK